MGPLAPSINHGLRSRLLASLLSMRSNTRRRRKWPDEKTQSKKASAEAIEEITVVDQSRSEGDVETSRGLFEGEKGSSVTENQTEEANMTRTKTEKPVINLNSQEVKDLSVKIMDTIRENDCDFEVIWMALLRTLTNLVATANQDLRHWLLNDLKEEFFPWLSSTTTDDEMERVKRGVN
jgi:hypothetical protein